MGVGDPMPCGLADLQNRCSAKAGSLFFVFELVSWTLEQGLAHEDYNAPTGLPTRWKAYCVSVWSWHFHFVHNLLHSLIAASPRQWLFVLLQAATAAGTAVEE